MYLIHLLMDMHVAVISSVPFRIAFRRARCIRRGHVITNSKVLETMVSKNHPQNDHEWVYKVYLLECAHCGLHFLDDGFGPQAQGAGPSAAIEAV